MKFGLNLGTVNPKFWVAFAREAEALGYESLWVPEHLVLPVQMSGSPMTGHEEPPIPSRTPVWDAFICLGMLAGVTETIRFGTNVYNIGLRHPFTTARSITTLDMVSNGRVVFGVGASWLREEWEATQLDFDTRGRRVDEAIRVCQRLWTEPEIEHHGEFFSFQPVMFEPKPVQKPWPAMLIGGDTPAAMRRAATLADGWLPMNHPIDVLAEGVKKVNELRAAAGREGPVAVTVGGRIQDLDDVERYRAAGVERVMVTPYQSSREAFDGIKRFADEILAAQA
jgi:probable F420-dependent oxidoreductase